MRYMLTALALTIAAPLGAQETRFTKQMSAGSTLEIENINGDVKVTQGSGRTAEIVVTKTVKRGDGNLVKAIMEERGGGVRAGILGPAAPLVRPGVPAARVPSR